MKKHLITILIIITISVWNISITAYEVGGVDIHGFISQGFVSSNAYNYLTHNSKDGSFGYNEMGINFSKQLNNKLRIGMQLFSRDLGDVSNNKILLDWAFADYRFHDWFGVRVGKMKLPLGLYNETRDMDMLRTCIVLPQGSYMDLTRDTLIATNGAGIYGHRELGDSGSIDYQLLVGVLPTDIDNGMGKSFNSHMASSGGVINKDFNSDTTYTGALWWEPPLEGFKLGYSFIHAPSEFPIVFSGTVETTVQVTTLRQIFSAELTWSNLVLRTEYMERKAESSVFGISTSSTTQSYYFLVSYAFNDLFTLGAYYSELYPDKDDKDGNNQTSNHMAWEKDFALTLRFNINEYWIFKLEGHLVDGTANVLWIDNSNINYSESKFSYGVAKMTFSF